jgi:hypothetical protein
MNKPKSRGRSRRPRSITPKKKPKKILNDEKKVFGGRGAPIESATEFDDGTIMLGQDDNYYVIARRSNDSLYWQRTRETLDRSALNNVVGDHKILIGDVQYMDYNKPTLTLNITDKFYKVLCKKPKKKICVETGGYVFGKLYDKDYICVGEFSDMSLLIAILNIDQNITEDEIAKMRGDRLWKKAYQNGKIHFFSNYDSRAGLAVAKKIISDKIVFTGQVGNKDIGLAVLVHITNNAIDSLIIDSDCYMPYTVRDNVNRY